MGAGRVRPGTVAPAAGKRIPGGPIPCQGSVSPWGMDLPLRIEVIDAHLPHPLRGCTDGHTIWLHEHLTHSQRRVVFLHELTHVYHRHASPQPRLVEDQIDAGVARWLLHDVDALADALAAAGGCVDVAADDLAVTPRILQLRLDTFYDYEAAHFRARLADHIHP